MSAPAKELAASDGERIVLFVGGGADHNLRAVRFLEQEVAPRLGAGARILVAGKAADAVRDGGAVVAVGAGLSSSAALECAAAIAWCASHFGEAPPVVNLFDPTMATRGALAARLRERGWNGRMLWVPISAVALATSSPVMYRSVSGRRYSSGRSRSSDSTQALDRIPRIPTSLRRVPQRAVDLGGEARERAEQCITVQPVQHALALALAADQAGAHQHRQVVRDRRPAQREALGEVGGRQRGLRQEGEDAPARQRGQGVEDPLGSINLHVNSMADFASL